MVNFYSLALYSWLIPVFPLAGFLINTLGHRKLTGIKAGVIASVTVGSAFLFAFVLFLLQKQLSNPTIIVTLGTWMSVGKLHVPFELLIDPLSITMMMIVTGVGFLIHVYSIAYMHDD